jgi:hypothetical protein
VFGISAAISVHSTALTAGIELPTARSVAAQRSLSPPFSCLGSDPEAAKAASSAARSTKICS